MTTEEIEKRIQDIRNIADDDESAHYEQDILYLDFIKYVESLSEHLPDLAAKAKLVASVRDIKFARWYA